MARQQLVICGFHCVYENLNNQPTKRPTNERFDFCILLFFQFFSFFTTPMHVFFVFVSISGPQFPILTKTTTKSNQIVFLLLILLVIHSFSNRKNTRNSCHNSFNQVFIVTVLVLKLLSLATLLIFFQIHYQDIPLNTHGGENFSLLSFSS